MSNIEIRFEHGGVDIIFNGENLMFEKDNQPFFVVNKNELVVFLRKLEIIKKVHEMTGEKND